MGHLRITRRRQARTIITGTVDEAVRAGKLTKHNLSDIDIKDTGDAKNAAPPITIGSGKRRVSFRAAPPHSRGTGMPGFIQLSCSGKHSPG
jgi:hypothetical protein